LFGDATWSFDTAVVQPDEKKPVRTGRPRTREEVTHALAENRLRVFPRKTDLPTLGAALRSEEKPALVDLSVITLHVAKSLPISATLAGTAVQAALNRIQQKELHKELTEGASYTENIQVVTDRTALAREAMAALQELPHAEEEDYRIIVQTLSARLRPTLDAVLAALPSDAHMSDRDLLRLTRDAAHWVIRDSAQELQRQSFRRLPIRLSQ
jgi:hypothetical protein